MIHIRQVLVGKRGNYWYKDTNERQAKTLCGVAPTDRDIVDTKNGLEWLHEHNGCAECAKLARWTKKEGDKMKYLRIKIADSKSTCPICNKINNHRTGDVCEHCYKLTVKGIVFYKANGTH